MGRFFKAAIALALVFLAFNPNTTATAFPRYFQVPSGPRTSLRGRIYVRNGPLMSVYRERWGNGITANGASVLNTLITTAGTVLVDGQGDGGEGNGSTDGDVLSTSNEEAADQFVPGKWESEMNEINEITDRVLRKLGIDPTDVDAAASENDDEGDNSNSSDDVGNLPLDP